MNNYKQFKDPIYGYINIQDDYVKNIIDTSVFQRLRRVTQTSYAPLYASSVHNRFIHSIGVFHLGQMASNIIKGYLQTIEETKELDDWEHVAKIFELACLLHDVGHAPFSHTGEKYFLENEKGPKRYDKLHNVLKSVVNSERFAKDIPVASMAAAAHEIMSAVVGIKKFGKYFTSDFEREFFARCITGYQYSGFDKKESIYNCFIMILNSKVIDVDRLDYLIRDAYFSGFQTINIDYMRLLSSLTIVLSSVKDEEKTYEKYELAFNKNAISVIENVVYGHDSERKWIQTHPIVLYDMYIIQHIVDYLEKNTQCGEVHLFSEDALSENGVTLANNLKVSLLCDDDIVHLLKSHKDDKLCNEFFSRKDRRHPLWKSEAEYKANIELRYGKGKVLDNLNEALKETETYVRKNTDTWIINDEIIHKLKNDLLNTGNPSDEDIDIKTLNAQKRVKKKILKVMECLQEYANSIGEQCDFVILNADQFYSGFDREEFGKIKIVFPSDNVDDIEEDNAHLFQDIISTLEGTGEKNKDFFYLYYNVKNDSKFDRKALCKKLYFTFS